jgi:hypothetical protein
MKYTPNINDKTERLARGITLVRSGEIMYIEATFRSPTVGFAETAQFDVLPGGLLEAMEQARAWWKRKDLDMHAARKRRNTATRRELRIRGEMRAVEAHVAQTIESQIEREIHNGSVVEAARQDVARVWARYGPALDAHRYRTSDFQW